MSEIILMVTATCRTSGCNQYGVANVFDRESGIEFVVYCGQCQKIISEISTAPKE